MFLQPLSSLTLENPPPMPAQDPKPPNGCLCISPLCFLHRCLSCNFSAADKSNQLVPLTQPKALKKLSFVFELPAFHLNALRNFGPHPNCWACLLPPCLYRLVCILLVKKSYPLLSNLLDTQASPYSFKPAIVGQPEWGSRIGLGEP